MTPDDPTPDPPGVFTTRDGRLCLGGAPILPGDSVYAAKFGCARADDPPDLADRLADHADAALLAAAVVLAALLWRKR